MPEPPVEMTAPLKEGGATEVGDALFASLYEELRQIAQRELRRGAALTLSPTTLLHETYFKLQRTGVVLADQSRFVAYAARAMRTLIIDYARTRQAQKRGGGFEITSLSTELPDSVLEVTELEALGLAIYALSEIDPGLAQLVDLKFFCGYSLIEIAAMRGVSERTAQRDWDKARALLKRSMEGRPLLPE